MRAAWGTFRKRRRVSRDTGFDRVWAVRANGEGDEGDGAGRLSFRWIAEACVDMATQMFPGQQRFRWGGEA